MFCWYEKCYCDVILLGYTTELHEFVTASSNISLPEINRWENAMVSQFETDIGRKWREGNSKMSFNYLLLDPRTTKNLPARHHILGKRSKLHKLYSMRPLEAY